MTDTDNSNPPCGCPGCGRSCCRAPEDVNDDRCSDCRPTVTLLARRPRTWTVIALAVLLGIAIAAVTAAIAYHRGVITVGDRSAEPVVESSGTLAATAIDATGRLELAGNVDGLYPGAAKTLTAVVRNTQQHPVQLTALEVEVQDASALCPAAVLSVTPFTLPMVPAAGTAPASAVISLAANAPAACKGASWPLRYRAKAEPAR